MLPLNVGLKNWLATQVMSKAYVASTGSIIPDQQG